MQALVPLHHLIKTLIPPVERPYDLHNLLLSEGHTSQ